MASPNPPVWAAVAATAVVPVPRLPSQLASEPDSKPSEKTTFVYCDSAGAGVTTAAVTESGPVPIELIAATVNAYGVPFVRPVTVVLVCVAPTRIGVCAVPLIQGVTRYAVIGAPPSEDGAVQLNATLPSLAVSTTPVGAPGRVAGFGVTAALCVELGPIPTPLIAATANVYAVPSVRPGTV